MITISLIAFIVTISVSSSSFLRRTLVKSELEKLYSACMYLQRVAMVTNQKQTLIFDTAQNTYCYNNKKEKLCSSVLFGTCTNVKGPPSTPTIIIDKPITCAGCKITFTPNGIAQPGTVYLTDKQKQYQYALTIPVSQISFLRMYRYDGTWKPLN